MASHPTSTQQTPPLKRHCPLSQIRFFQRDRANAFCLLGLALAGIFAGCTRFESKPLSAENSLGRFQERRLDSPGLRTFIETNLQTNLTAWPMPAWDLKGLTLVAFYYSPDLDLARARRAVAEAGKATAGERPNPTLGVAPAYNTSTAIPSPWLVSPTLDVPIETAGKRGHRLAQASHLARAAALNLDVAAWQLRSQVRRSLLEVCAAAQTEVLLEEQQKIEDENIRLMERQFQEGAISAYEWTQARLARDNARLARLDAQAQGAEARMKLADTLGVPASALDGVRFAFEELTRVPAEPTAPEARRATLLNRSDILCALAEYEASQSALQLEIAKQYPDIHLNPGYEFDQGDNKWSVGLSVTLPVLNSNQGAIKEALARREEAAAKFNALQAQTLGEIDRALAACKIALQKYAETDAMLADLKKQEALSRKMFEAGEIAKTDLTALRLQLNASALACQEATMKAQMAFGQLEDVLQSPFGLPSPAWETSPIRSASSPRLDTPRYP